MRARDGLTVFLLTCAAASGLRAEEQGPYATGSLAWIASDRLDLVGSVAAELPLAQAGPWRIFTSLGAVTAIEKATSNFTFLVDHVSYDATIGARRPLGDRGAIEVFAGERGVALVDANGSLRVRLAGVAWESSDHHRAFGPFGWSGRASLAAVLTDRNVAAGAVAAGSVRYLGRIASRPHLALGADATVDALIGEDGGVDYSAGPRMEFDLSGDRRFALFARWLHGGSPLGLGTDGVIAGFDFANGLHPDGPRSTPPEISGLAAAGGGEDRRALARLTLRVATPPFLSGTYAEVEVDGNLLTGDDLDDLFYLYDVGVAHPFSTWRAGVWFHHRSNHVASGVNPTVTSIDVLEAGVGTEGWNRAEPSGWNGRLGSLDAMLRGGWLIDSAFGKAVDWHARAGMRWSSRQLGPVRLYVAAEAERGDVAASAYGAGALLPRGWDVRFEARHDEQLYSVDRRAKLLVATLRY